MWHRGVNVGIVVACCKKWRKASLNILTLYWAPSCCTSSKGHSMQRWEKSLSYFCLESKISLQLLDQNPDLPVAQMYGGEYLLRLFGTRRKPWISLLQQQSFFTVKLGSFLAYTTMDEESIRHLLEHIEDLLRCGTIFGLWSVGARICLFCRYLQDNADDIFKKEYQVAPPDYFRKAIS